MRLRFQSPIYREYADDWGSEKLVCLRWPLRISGKSKILRWLRGDDLVPLRGELVSYVIMDEHITMLDVDSSQFVAMLQKVASPGLYLWNEDELFPRLRSHDPRLWGDWIWVG
jgi:hypothetical protein